MCMDIITIYHDGAHLIIIVVIKHIKLSCYSSLEPRWNYGSGLEVLLVSLDPGGECSTFRKWAHTAQRGTVST